MAKDDFERREEKKVVSAKLFRREFANFMRVCGEENKTANMKIRELINREVAENFANPKIREFIEHALEDYNESLVVEDISKVSLVEKADSSFVEIGIRPLLDDDIFTSPNFSPILPSIGRIVAIGERDSMIWEILNNKEIETIEAGSDMKKFPKYIDFNEGCVLISTKFYVEIFTKLAHRIDYKSGGAILDGRYKIISVPKKFLGSRIILIGKDAILWEKQVFKNRITGGIEKLDINIKPVAGGKVDISVRSVNKMKHVDIDQVKILEVKNGE